MGFIYVLRSKKNNRYYIGSTNNLKRRLAEHNSGHSKYTRESLPFELVFSQRFPTLLVARKVENWLKKQKSKKLLSQIVEDGKINKALEYQK